MNVLEQETPRKVYVRPKIEEVTLSLDEAVLGSVPSPDGSGSDLDFLFDF